MKKCENIFFFWCTDLASYYNLSKDGARRPRTLKMFVRYLLPGFLTDLNETWHSKGPRAGEQPREVGILILQTVAMEIGKVQIEDGARRPRTLLRTEPGSLGHFSPVWEFKGFREYL